MKYNNIIFLGLCLGLTTYSALSADSVIKISGRVLDYGCTVSSDSLNFTVDLQKNSARQFPTTGSTSPVVPFQITLRGILFQITMLLCQQAAAPLIVVMSLWISRTFLEAQKYPLAYIAQANKSSHFIFRVPPLTVADKCLLTQHLMQQKHREWVSL